MDQTKPQPLLPETPIRMSCSIVGIPAAKEAIEQEIQAFNQWIITNLEGYPLHPLEHAILRTYLQLRLVAPQAAETMPPTAQ
jgi:hypothetical protein